MAAPISPHNLAIEIKRIFVKYPSDADTRVESYLNDRLGALALQDRIDLVQQTADQLGENTMPLKNEEGMQQEIITDLFLLLLGREATRTDLESKAQLESLARALNTIFDTLNHLIEVINTTLRGTSLQQETIRGLIGKNVANQGSTASMAAHLGQIEQAFLTSQKALQAAARVVVDEILTELDPENIDNDRQSGRIGPFRKKETLNMLKEKHRRCRRWFESHRFEEKLLRAFEKSCGQHFGL